MKEFTTNGICDPAVHYMVDIHERLEKMQEMVEDGKYFAINCARQYGKSTTLAELGDLLRNRFYVVSLDFEEYGKESFSSEGLFCSDFALDFTDVLLQELEACPEDGETVRAVRALGERGKKDAAAGGGDLRLFTLFRALREIWDSSRRPIVLLCDEVDSASNHQVFLDFLGQLRASYLKNRKGKGGRAFQSVILAGVRDIKHLKRKIRDEDQHKVNSPWNIAADFDIDMRLMETGIAGMLQEYEMDHHTGMDTGALARDIYAYSGGYPFLVSRICQIIHQRIVPGRHGQHPTAWSGGGVAEAVRIILSEKNTLFDSLTGKLANFPGLKGILARILLGGERIPYNPDQESLAQMEMYGFIRNRENVVTVANRIFEIRLYNLLLTDEILQGSPISKQGDFERNLFVTPHGLDMRMVLEHYREAFASIFGSQTGKFSEADGRKQFLLYLKPIINGTGNYYIEAETRDQKRADIVVDYHGRQYVIELKLWNGAKYHREGEEQLAGYLERFGLEEGYMLIYNFRKRKETWTREVLVRRKRIFEVMV